MTAPMTMVGRIHAKLDQPGGYAPMRAALRNVLQAHRPFGIYTDCGHLHEYTEEGQVPDGIVEVNDLGLVCESARLYAICSACCTDDGDTQTAQCADAHEHHDPDRACWPCPTVRGIAAPLGVQQ